MTMEDELPESALLSDTVLCVRYKGTSDLRIVSQRDLSGDPNGDATDQIAWTPGSEIAWFSWERLAGSEERAREVFAQHSHEFELVGPGAEDFAYADGEEEFSIGGAVE